MRFSASFQSVLTILFSSIGLFGLAVPAESASPLDEWTYQQAITLVAPEATLVDAAVLITLNPGTFDYARALPDGSDLRFSTDGTGFQAPDLPHWIESYDPAGTSRIWIRVPLVPANAGVTIYLYYGNPEAHNVENGDLVFDFFDDFEGSELDGTKWMILQNQGSIVVEAGVLKLFRPGAAGGSRIDMASREEFQGGNEVYLKLLMPEAPHYYTNVYYGGCNFNACSYASLGYVAFNQYESALHTGDTKYPPRTTGKTRTEGDQVADPPIGSWFSDRFAVSPEAPLSRQRLGAATEVAMRYNGVSDGSIGLFMSSPDIFFQQNAQTWVDHIFVRRLIENPPAISIGNVDQALYPLEPPDFNLDAPFVLFPIFPHPVHSIGRLRLYVRDTQQVLVNLFDSVGRHVGTLHDRELRGGRTVEFTVNALPLSSGSYVVRIDGEMFTTSRAIVVLK